MKLQADDFKRGERRIMVYLRATALVLAVLLFLCVTPLQWIALRRHWPLRLWLPVAFSLTLATFLRLDVCIQSATQPEGPRLIVANHLSWLDIVAVCCVEPVCFLAKREIGSCDGSALRKFSSHLAAARDLLAKDDKVETVWVQPIAIRYSTPAAPWFGDATLLPHLWSILKGEPIRCDLVFGQPLAYVRGENRKVITGHAASAIAGMLASMARTVEPDLAARTKTPAFAPSRRIPRAFSGDASTGSPSENALTL
jgi:lyso-ornithine lipid O-acyltransferase